MGVKEIIGSSEYGEKPYLISEMVGNFSHDVIAHGYDPHDALDNYVEYGQEKYSWAVPEVTADELEEGHYYMANGNFPLNLEYLQIKEIDKEYVNEVSEKLNKKANRKLGREQGMEM